MINEDWSKQLACEPSEQFVEAIARTLKIHSQSQSQPKPTFNFGCSLVPFDLENRSPKAAQQKSKFHSCDLLILIFDS
jgi:hypothetical protein